MRERDRDIEGEKEIEIERKRDKYICMSMYTYIKRVDISMQINWKAEGTQVILYLYI